MVDVGGKAATRRIAVAGGRIEMAAATRPFLAFQFTIPLTQWSFGFEGFELNRLATLMALSGVFLLLVIVNGLFKFYINTYKGRLGERLLRRIRYELVDRLLRFLPASKRLVDGD